MELLNELYRESPKFIKSSEDIKRAWGLVFRFGTIWSQMRI